MATSHSRDGKTTQWGYNILRAEIKTGSISEKLYRTFCNEELTSPFVRSFSLLRMANYLPQPPGSKLFTIKSYLLLKYRVCKSLNEGNLPLRSLGNTSLHSTYYICYTTHSITTRARVTTSSAMSTRITH